MKIRRSKILQLGLLVLVGTFLTRWEAVPSESVSAGLLISESGTAQVLSDRLDLFPKTQVSKLSHYLHLLCQEYQFDPAFILSIIQTESEFRIRAVSPMGAIGLMQLMPSTAKQVAVLQGFPPVDARSLADPYVNLRIGIAYLSMLRDHYKGLPQFFVLSAYNMGPGKTDQMLSRKAVHPVKTAVYFKKIQRGVSEILNPEYGPDLKPFLGKSESLRLRRFSSSGSKLGV
jgi:soluble lytic murein transglycosylase-like protein